MKHGINPTVAQKHVLKSWGLNADNWLVVKNTPASMLIKHRLLNQTKEIRKEGLQCS